MGETAATLELDRTFAGYRVRRPLGKGGMSDVYLVERAGQGGALERFALKVVLPQFQGDPERDALFVREVRIAAALRHPNIVGVVDHGEVDDVRYLVLEYVDGLDLRTLCNRLGTAAQTHGASYPGQERGALPPPVVAWIGLGVARGLHAAHMQASEDGRLLGFVHRDVAPGNLFLDARGQVKVADFGISKAIHAETEAVSTTAQARGRTFYMAPEQIGGALTRASDLYSLGVVLFELLAGSGRHPFEDPRYPNQDPIGLMSRAGRGQRAFTIAEALPELPSRFHALLEQLAHPDPAKRPASAESVASELTAILGEMGEDMQAAERLARWTLGLVYPSQDAEPPTAETSGSVTTGIQPSASARAANLEQAMKRATEEPTTPQPSTPTTGVQPAGTHAGALDEPDTAHTPRPVAFEPGMRIGKYTILYELSRGGMGATFVAKSDLGKRVCLKTILPEYAANPQFRESFHREAEIAAKVSHPKIAQLFDFGEHEGTLWSASELVDGTDLNTILRASPQGALESREAACILFDVAQGLLHVHTPDHRRPRPIIHRDVSAKNVLISFEGDAKLIDFGIAKMPEGESTQTDAKGKLPYMAPEVLRGEEIKPSVDLWALGVLTHRMLTGRLPYKNAYDGTRPPAPVSPRGPLDPRWSSIVARLLEPDPSQRYPSLAMLLDELAPLLPEPSARLELGRRIRKKHPTKSIAAGASAQLLNAAIDELNERRKRKGPMDTSASDAAPEPRAEGASARRPTPEPVAASGRATPEPHAATPVPLAPAPEPRSAPAAAHPRPVGKLEPDDRIGTWTVVSKLGEGGMAIVYKVSRVLAGATQYAALKLVRPHILDDKDGDEEARKRRLYFLKCFRDEARISVSLQHDNLVRVYDAGEIDGLPFIAMEFIDGCDLNHFVEALTKLGILYERRLPPELVAYFGVGLFEGLAYAHTGDGERPAIVHRDVSPHNILITRDGNVKVSDVGIAKPTGDDGKIDKTVHMVGKPGYMAPEQYRGLPLDRRADLYAAGITLYEALAGVSPFEAYAIPGEKKFDMVAHRVLTGHKPPLSERAPAGTPVELIQIVERLLALNPEDRPASAHDVLAVLDPLVSRKTKRDVAELMRVVKGEPPESLSPSVLDAVRVSALPPPPRGGGTLQLPSGPTPSSPGLAPSPGLTPAAPGSAQAFTGELAAPSSSRILVLAIAILALVAVGLVAFGMFWPADDGRSQPEPPTASQSSTPEAAEGAPRTSEAPAEPSAASSDAPATAAESTPSAPLPVPPNEPAVAAPEPAETAEPAESQQDDTPSPAAPREAPRRSTHRHAAPRVAPAPVPGPSSPPPRGRSRGGNFSGRGFF